MAEESDAKDVSKKDVLKAIGMLLIAILTVFLIKVKPDQIMLDNDGDNHSGIEDCNDDNPSIYKGAVDVPGDGIDQDCDGVDALIVFDPNEAEKKKFDVYDNLGEMQKAIVYANFLSPNFPTPDGIYGISKKIEISGKENFEKIFLYVDASAGTASPLSARDSIYFYINDGLSGGHLVRKNSLPTRKSEISTRVLYDLMQPMEFTSVPYVDSNPKIVLKRNFYEDIIRKVSLSRFFIGTFISLGGDSGTGRINELAIYYTCKQELPCSIFKVN